MTRLWARLAQVGLWRPLAAIVVVAVLYCGKAYYGAASADDLRWILAPTAYLVSLFTGIDFAFESGAGYLSREAAFIIAPACAGLNFLLAAFLALTVGSLPRMVSARAVASGLAVSLVLALAATLVVNTLRIAIALSLHQGTFPTIGLTPEEVHRIEGICVYLGGLLALYGVARGVASRAAEVAHG